MGKTLPTPECDAPKIESFGASSPNAAQRASPSFRLPELDPDLLRGDSMRGVRFLLEYAKAEEQLRAWGVRSTIVVFGSARVRESGLGRHGFWYAQARAFGRLASERGGALHPNGSIRDNVIATGGGPGLMEAANTSRCERPTLPCGQMPWWPSRAALARSTSSSRSSI